MHTIPAAAGRSGLLWYDGMLVRIAADHDATAGDLALLEVWAPVGSGWPPHVHGREDESILVLAGAVRVTVGPEAGRRLGPGEVARLPRRVPHAVEVLEDAHLVVVCTPAGFEAAVRDLGVEAPTATFPDAGTALAADDVAALLARHDVSLLGGVR
jgi:quercetin dioxygenase-like cupin family protein